LKSSAERKLAAQRFVEEWRSRGQEDEDDQTFWNQFLQEVMGLDRVHHQIDYQKKVKIGRSTKRIDGYIPSSKVLIEQKTRCIDLRKSSAQSDGESLSPYEQARRYANSLPNSERPNFIITSNFESFLIYDLERDPNGENPEEVLLEELPNQFYLFDFIIDPINATIERQKQVNLEAAERIGTLYDKVKSQYKNPAAARHPLAVLMVRILFCLYAEDSGLFEKNLFYDYLLKVPAGQGLMRRAFIDLFTTLNTAQDKRDPYIGELLSQFPYVNGGLFAEEIEIPIFTDDIKFHLLQKSSHQFDWSQIDPSIFGAIFTSILSGEERRAGGMHYTSPENIHKVIDPLFLDDLRSELNEAGNEKPKLRALQDKIASLTFFDPACGSGNFLTQAYLNLRALENEIIYRLAEGQMSLDVGDLIKVNVGQFYGIEINDFAVSVANVALWIADHQANQETAKIVQRNYINLPLQNYHHIVCANALTMDWNELLPAQKCSYIMGNPPFNGYSTMSKEQSTEMLEVFNNRKGANTLDYVSAWYKKAADYSQATTIHCAFVSTNSIVQGQQVFPLWHPLFTRGIKINFAHQTFIWNSQDTNLAHVHCVIIGFSYQEKSPSALYSYKGGKGQAARQEVQHINAYLVDAPDTFVDSRSTPISNVPPMVYGNKPADGGNLFLTQEERTTLIQSEPDAEKYIKKILGATEFIKGINRYCLWLVGISPTELKDLPMVRGRVEKVRQFRLTSTKAATREDANISTLFTEIRQNDRDYIIVPRHSSENRKYVPIGFVSAEIKVNDAVSIIPNAEIYHFGILTSQFHNAWMRVVAGRIKSDYRYSTTIVYNNFIWPTQTEGKRQQIESLAQAVLDARANYPESSLADLYDPLLMPPDLLRAHKALDKAVEQAYGVNFNGNEEKIVAHLFKLYAEATNNTAESG
jgi:hypothetical protein